MRALWVFFLLCIIYLSLNMSWKVEWSLSEVWSPSTKASILWKQIANFDTIVVSVTELVTKSLSSESMGARLRPRQYKTFPESTLNATLKDVHDFAQYAVVQGQKIVYGQDLEKTFAVSFPSLPFSNVEQFQYSYHLTDKFKGFHWRNRSILLDTDRSGLLADRNWLDLRFHRSPSLLSKRPSSSSRCQCGCSRYG